MSTIRAIFTIVTPMFLGGSANTPPELRPPSIKGALRFWWRASSWGRCLADSGGDVAMGLRLLHAQEGHLFGAAATESGGGQGCFRLRARMEGQARVGHPPRPRTGQAYLLGQGLVSGTSYSRRALLADQSFEVVLHFRRQTSEEDQREVERALLLWGMLGGLGSRARRGYGSVALETLEGGSRSVPKNLAQFREALLAVVERRERGLPPLTAFSQRSRVDHSLKSGDPMELLEAVGVEMKMYRSWGRNGWVDGVSGDAGFGGRRPSEQNFEDDHEVALRVAEGNPPRGLPKRIAFGLPHNYFFSSVGKKVDYNALDDASGENLRRASPLLIHLHRFPNGECSAIQTFLPGLFLPPGVRVGIQTNRPRRNYRSHFHLDDSVLRGYLDRFQNLGSWEGLA